MIKSRIIINIHDNTPQEIAVERVLSVIKGGRVSKNNALYCYGSIFSDGVHVFVNDYRKADVFSVYTKKNEL